MQVFQSPFSSSNMGALTPSLTPLGHHNVREDLPYERGAIVPNEGPNGAERSPSYVTEVHHVGRHMLQLHSVSNFLLGIVFRRTRDTSTTFVTCSGIEKPVRTYNLHPVEILDSFLLKGAAPSVRLYSPSCSSQEAGSTPGPLAYGRWGPCRKCV